MAPEEDVDGQLGAPRIHQRPKLTEVGGKRQIKQDIHGLLGNEASANICCRDRRETTLFVGPDAALIVEWVSFLPTRLADGIRLLTACHRRTTKEV